MQKLLDKLTNIGSLMADSIVNVIRLLVLTLVVGLICSMPMMLLWNWLVPTVFGFASVNLPQALGLTFLAEMLFSPYTYISIKLK